MNTMRRSWTAATPRTGLAIAGLALLGACGGLRADRAAPQAYALRYQPPAAAAPAAGDAATTRPLAPDPAAPALQVLRPVAAPGLEGDAIAVLREGRRLDGYLGARWAGPLPELVGAMAVEALRARGRYRAVEGPASAFASEQVLQLSIERCEAVYAGADVPTVQVRIIASFGRRDDRRLLATQRLEASVPAQANRMGEVAAAFEQALGIALSQLAPP